MEGPLREDFKGLYEHPSYEGYGSGFGFGSVEGEGFGDGQGIE